MAGTALQRHSAQLMAKLYPAFSRRATQVCILSAALEKIEAGNCIDPRTVAREALEQADPFGWTERNVGSHEGLGFTAEASPRVLDPCSGSRMMWFDRGHPDAVFGDRRRETLTVTDRSHGRADGTRSLKVDPDLLMDFRALPFEDGTFRLVAFDPPHLVRAGPRSWLAAKYGKLGQDWRDDLRQGFAECFRVLHADGVLVFKWNETQVKLSEVLALTPHAPLFGNTSGKKAGTHWLVFMKPNARIQPRR